MIFENFTRLTAREITYNNFEISLVVFMPNITPNHAITYTNPEIWDYLRLDIWVWGRGRDNVEIVRRTYGKILATPLFISMQNTQKPPPTKNFPRLLI